MGKVLNRQELLDKIKKLNLQRKTIGLTNGCFDLLHTGHIKSIEEAKHNCDCLVVLVNSDTSIKQLKGETRPIIKEADRAYTLSSLIYVDFVCLFDETSPLKLIELIKPDIYFKGSDYDLNELPEAVAVKSYGGRVENLKLIEGYSTTKLIEKIKVSF